MQSRSTVQTTPGRSVNRFSINVDVLAKCDRDKDSAALHTHAYDESDWKNRRSGRVPTTDVCVPLHATLGVALKL